MSTAEIRRSHVFFFGGLLPFKKFLPQIMLRMTKTPIMLRLLTSSFLCVPLAHHGGGVNRVPFLVMLVRSIGFVSLACTYWFCTVCCSKVINWNNKCFVFAWHGVNSTLHSAPFQAFPVTPKPQFLNFFFVPSWKRFG